MIYNFVAEQTEAGLDFNIALDKDKRVYCFGEQRPRFISAGGKRYAVRR